MAIQTIQKTFLGSVAIPDPGSINNTIAFTGHVPSGVVPTIELINLSILHTFASDLEVSLTNPGGTTVDLFTDVGGSDAGFIDITLSDGALVDIATVNNADDDPDTGLFKPEGPALLSSLATGSMTGNWTLHVADDSLADVGKLLSWGIRITFSYNGTVTGTAAADNLGGSDVADKMFGLNGNDKIHAFDGNDQLFGGNGNDGLSGNNGNDVLAGGLGIDTMAGGANIDFFVFDTAPNTALNRDIIIDFSHADDAFRMENAIFTHLGAAGLLNPAFFRAGAAALDANDFIVYNQATGILSYDSNGNAAGGIVQVALLTNKPVLAYNDFAVI
jgi:Ca2+-binding RTX toxin-like protein